MIRTVTPPPKQANYLDLTSKHAGTISAVGNMLASLPGVVAPIAVASILHAYHDWGMVFYVLAGCNSTGIVVAYFALSTTSIDEEGDLHIDADADTTDKTGD